VALSVHLHLTSPKLFYTILFGSRVKLSITYFSGFEIGCVSSERYLKMCKMERNIADGIEFLKSIVNPANHWRHLLHMPAAKGTLLKR
jgi:NAD/FAD-utilizing enzyme apparently involved in cell division